MKSTIIQKPAATGNYGVGRRNRISLTRGKFAIVDEIDYCV